MYCEKPPNQIWINYHSFGHRRTHFGENFVGIFRLKKEMKVTAVREIICILCL
uniref:Uncharacterized protein n=1 Tax=Rhizophora mucronata TaxID=61149 RepID=A0A2P2IKD9_RHIMU